MTHAQTASSELIDSVRASVQVGLPAAIAELCGLVRIPSVSWDAFDPANVDASAEAVARLLKELDVFDSVQVSRATVGTTEQLGQSAVLATRKAKLGKPTVLLYAHHDVQPPGSSSDWDSSPFEPTVRGDRLYGRGAADDKAGVMVHIAAIRALIRVLGGDFDLGLVVFVEGEEEFGSRSFKNFLIQHEQELAADVIIVADSNNVDVKTPGLTVALRGNVTFKLTVRTLEHASHSGMFGGAVPDAMLAMVQLLATLNNPDGSVAVDGLVSSQELIAPEYPESQLRKEAALLDGVTPIGRGSILSRIWSQPAITITGIDAPTVANASNTLIPAVSVRISARVAPGQTASSARRALEEHLTSRAPFGAKVEISEVDEADPFLVDSAGWAFTDAKAAMASAWGTDAVEVGIGGSIPFISDLVEVFPTAQILVTGVEDPDSRAHSPNESLHLGVFHRAIVAEALMLARFNGRH